MPVVMTRPGSDAAAAASRPGWLGSLGIAAGGAVASMVAMFWLRSAYQIRTLPERVLEWVLLFVPPDTLERGISQFGAQAKVYALYVAVTGMGEIFVGSEAVEESVTVGATVS